MKKLKLKLEGKLLLSKDQMKKITGGYGMCGAYLPGGVARNACSVSFETACFNGTYDPAEAVFLGISYADATCLTAGISGAHWCCSGCSTASWYHCPI